jgi:hypothetical protein
MNMRREYASVQIIPGPRLGGKIYVGMHRRF